MIQERLCPFIQNTEHTKGMGECGPHCVFFDAIEGPSACAFVQGVQNIADALESMSESLGALAASGLLARL